MTVVGETTRFAIEYTVDPDPIGEWLNGALSIWIAGERVLHGDVSLRDYVYILEGISTLRGRCGNPRLFAEPTPRLAALLDAALLSGTDPELRRLAEDEQWGLFVLDFGFGSNVYAIEDGVGHSIRLLADIHGRLTDIVLGSEEFYSTVATARDDLHQRMVQASDAASRVSEKPPR